MGSTDVRQAVAAGELVSARDLPPTEANAVNLVGLANLSPPGFLAGLTHAALDAKAVGLLGSLESLDRARQEPRGRALDRGDKRRSVQDLFDEIDLNLQAGNATGEGQGSAVPQETPTQSGAPHRSVPLMHRSAIRQRKRSVSSTIDNLDNHGERKDESTGAGLSTKRGRKRSKYLLPPYTNGLDGLDLDDEEDVDVQEVLLLVRGFAKDTFHRRYFPKTAKGFLGMLRNSMFLPENTFAYGAAVPECPAEDVFAKPIADATIALSDSSCDPEKKQGNGVFQGSARKNDQDGRGGSSIKGKEVEKTTQPKNALSHGLIITPATPIREVRPEDVISQVKSGAEVDTITSVQGQTEIVSATIGLLPMHEGVSSQPTDGNEYTVQQQKRNASLQVMVLEVPNIHPLAPAPTSRLSIPEMRKGVKHMISHLQNGVKPVQEKLLGDLQRLLENLDRAQPRPSSSAAASS